MRYKNYEGYTKTYVVVYNTGFGVMEDPYIEHEVVYETDDKDQAYKVALEYVKLNNTEDQIKGSWIFINYHVNINTLSEGGKILEKQFMKNFDEIWENSNDNPDYTEFNVNGQKIRIMKHPLFDSPLSYPTKIIYSNLKKKEDEL